MNDKDLIGDIRDRLKKVLQKLPKKITSHERAPLLMYNATLYLVKDICTVLSIDRQTMKLHMDAVWGPDTLTRDVQFDPSDMN